MNAKERFYSGLAKETIGKITSNTDNWTSFLRTMSRNYEFTYPEQVMIYAQRPNATFCKPYEDWNAENYRRYVKRGSTGIALFVMFSLVNHKVEISPPVVSLHSWQKSKLRHPDSGNPTPIFHLQTLSHNIGIQVHNQSFLVSSLYYYLQLTKISYF